MVAKRASENLTRAGAALIEKNRQMDRVKDRIVARVNAIASAKLESEENKTKRRTWTNFGEIRRNSENINENRQF